MTDVELRHTLIPTVRDIVTAQVEQVQSELKRLARQRAAKIRQAREQAMRDMGLTKVRGALGGT